MTEKQKALLFKLGEVFSEIAYECENDEAFHNIMIDNNDLFSMSLDELAAEYNAIAEGQRFK